MMPDSYFEIEGDVVVKYTPQPQCGEGVCIKEVVMDRETFKKCFDKWIKEEFNLTITMPGITYGR